MLKVQILNRNFSLFQLTISRHETETELIRHLHHLLENHSRVFILHCSAKVARLVFAAAVAEGFTGEGYAWFVTQVSNTNNICLKTDIKCSNYVGLEILVGLSSALY